MALAADKRTTPTQVFDTAKVAADVRAIANSGSPVAGLVREALDVIYQAFDEHGYILLSFILMRVSLTVSKTRACLA